MMLLTGVELTIRYKHKEVFAGLNFAVSPGSRIGLVGRNGAGKTTMMKLLAGQLEPDEGEIIKAQGLRIAYVSQDETPEPSLTVEQYIMGISHANLEEYVAHEERVRLLRAHFDIPDYSSSIGTLSGGQVRQIVLLRALSLDCDITLLDEPTNHLDLLRLDALAGLLESWPKTIITISHDRYFVDQIATEIWELDRGRLYVHPGNYHTFLDRQQKRFRDEEVRHIKLEADLKRELEWVRSGVKARGTKDEGRLKRYNELEKEFNSYRPKPPDLMLPVPKPPILGDKILILEEISISRPGNAQVVLIQDLNLRFHKKMRIGILGPNGSGKTTLIRTLLGHIKPARGVIRYGQNTIFNYQDQKRLELPAGDTIKQVISQGHNDLQFGERKMNVYAYLRKFLFHPDDLISTVDSLSGGQRARFILAKILKEGGNFLVLDEPTNDLDVDTMEALENTLLTFPGCVIVVSHDRFFLDKVCTHLLVLQGDGSHMLVDGGYSYFVRVHGGGPGGYQLDNSLEKDTVPDSSETVRIPKHANVKWERKIKADIRELEKQMELVRAGITQLEAEFADPSFYLTHNTPKLINMSMERLAARQEQLARLESKWIELNEKIDG